MRTIERIIIHCSGLAYGTVDGIRRYHVRHKGWSDIGYHYIVGNGRARARAAYDPSLDGRVWVGRPVELEGAHARGVNDDSIGLCLIGVRGAFGEREIPSAADFVAGLCRSYAVDVARVEGHNETPWQRELARRAAGGDAEAHPKTCPEIDMDAFRGMVRARLDLMARGGDCIGLV